MSPARLQVYLYFLGHHLETNYPRSTGTHRGLKRNKRRKKKIKKRMKKHTYMYLENHETFEGHPLKNRKI